MCYWPILILIQLIFVSLSTTFMCSDLNETILYLLFFLLVFRFWTCVLEHLHWKKQSHFIEEMPLYSKAAIKRCVESGELLMTFSRKGDVDMY